MARDDFRQKTHALPTRSFKAKRIGIPTTREPKREGGNNNSKASNSGARVNPSAGFRIETATLRRSEAAPDHARPSTQAHRQTWRRALRRACRRHGGWPYYDVCGYARRQTVDVVSRLRTARRPHTHPRLRADPRGRHAGIRQELEQGLIYPTRKGPE